MVRLLQTKKDKTAAEENVNALDFLKSQHREVEALFEEFEKLGDKAGRARQQIFNKISHALSCHARIEEKIFYPEGRPIDKDTTLEAYEEHDIVKSLLKKLAGTAPSDETFKAKMIVLKEVVQHHVEEEENEYFPKLEAELGEERLMELGAELKLAFEKVDAGHPEPRVRTKKRA